MAEALKMSKEKTTMSAKTIIATLAATLGLAAFAAAPALASEQIESFSTTSSTTEAGGHPDLITSFRLENPGQPEAAQNVTYDAPEGVFGNPNATTRCSQADFALSSCSTNAQVGIVTVRANHGGDPNSLLGTVPVFSLIPGAEQTALFAFQMPILNTPITIPVSVRTGSDYGLRFTVQDISQSDPLRGVDMTLWGFPAIPAHNTQRFSKGSPGNPPGCPLKADTSCISNALASSDQFHPLTSNPTICTGQPLVTKLTVQTYQDPGNATTAESSYEPTTECQREKFNPVTAANLTTNEADAPSGMDLVLKSPQFLSFAASPSQIRSSTVTMPPGLTINPDAADGQSMCTDAQVHLKDDGPSQCPDNSKIGTFEVKSPAIDNPLIGSLYIGEPQPGNQYRVFMVATGSGINAKLTASFHPDPKTGQLLLQTQNLPQVAFEEFDMHLFASDRGLLATPTHCSVYPVSAQFFPWNDQLSDQTSADFISVGAGPHGAPCPAQNRPFNPRLAAGTSNAKAGAFSSFTLKLDREDGDQFLGDLNFKMPPGFTGDLRGISYCPEASIAAAANNLGRTEQVLPSCPASSQVGTTNVAAGPGTHPFHAVGKMYMAGPFKGAPLSLVAITPALAGPYDYGVVVVRVALHVNPLTAQVSAVSDTVPSIIGGIPIRMRSIQVNIDRPKFTINPTNCSAFAVESQGIGDQGAIANFSSPFHAVNCATLPFKPKMTITQLGSRKQTKRNQDPSLRFDLNTRPGDANIKSVAVTLPKAFAVDQRHLGNICSRAQLAAEHCAGRQAIGMVSTETPLLDKPLAGPAYAVSGFGKLPHLAFILAGQVTIIPEAESSSVKGGHLKTVVPTVPDAPIGHFRLTLFGAKQGYLVNTRDLCAAPAVTTVEYTAQNNKKLTQKVAAKTACSKRARRAAKRHRGGH
jgi:hypothetical protein